MNEEKEIWKETNIDTNFGFTIFISNLGNAKRVLIKTGEEKPIVLKFNQSTNRIDLNKMLKGDNGIQKRIAYKQSLHKLVAHLFIPNPFPETLTEVVHLDRNVANNHCKNLKWVNKNEFRVHHSNYLKGKAAEKLIFFASERFKDFHFDTLRKRIYAVSNFGRIVIYKEDIEDGYLLKFNQKEVIRTPYIILRPNDPSMERKVIYVHQLVAAYFLPTKKQDQICVVHLDHNHENNHYSNLKWTTFDEKYAHSRQSPRVRAVQGDLMQQGTKLSKTQVIHIKRLIAKGKMRNKMIAKQFGISEMSIYRIKRGEAWAHVKLENE
ncbi:MAG: helix-turn-helix domain-containing protein [Cytophagales bacterium]